MRENSSEWWAQAHSLSPSSSPADFLTDKKERNACIDAHKALPHTFALLRICWQIRTEAQLLPWSLGTLDFDSVEAFDSWMAFAG